MPLVLTINAQAPEDIKLKQAADNFGPSKIIIYPTETFYALGTSFSDRVAIEKIFDLKGRNKHNPILLLIRDMATLPTLAARVPGQALLIAQKFWPGPLTLLFDAQDSLSSLLTADTGKIGCRISSCSTAQKLLTFLQSPLTSTSANLSGDISPTRIEHIPESIRNSVDIILDAGETPGGRPSTIIDVTKQPFSVVRDGAVPTKEILNCLA